MMPLQNSDVPAYDRELPLFSWEDVQPYLPISPHSRPSQVDSDLAGSSVASVLSACSYPLPERYSQDTRVDFSNAPFYGGLMLEDSESSYGDDGFQTASLEEDTVSHHPARMPSKQERGEASAVTSSRRRGRPRKATDNAEGRRRLQVRLAQRAYQSRREANVSSLKGRISRLRTSVEKTNAAVLSFNEKLVQSGILSANSDLSAHWENTMQKCLAQAREASRGNGALQHSDGSQDGHLTSSEQPHGPSIDRSEPSEFDLLSAFIERLQMVCVYHATSH
ncbi:hypothetical protein PHISP_03151 [Aspergillus sp. HF37]|nr:hypothetical protein PHISP_03151 [Aspergillus sp. HF37]